VDYLGDAVQSASHFNETVSKTGEILGHEALPELEAWASEAAAAFGLSEQSALDAASTFAIFGKSAGLAGDGLTGFSTDLTELAADFASFFDTSPEEAITAIGAALRGESEPIRRYGVLLNEATLRQRALTLGIITTTTQALTPQQRVLAAQAEIFAQSADAQGDFARTSGGLAAQQKILTAELENLQKEIGTELLPVMLELTRTAADLAPTLVQLIDPLIEIGGAIGHVINPIGGVVDAFEEASEAVEETDHLAEGTARNWMAMGEALRSGAGQVTAGARAMAHGIQEAARNARQDAVREMRALPGDIAKALRDGSHDVDAAMEQLTEDMANELDDAVRLAYLKGLLVSDELAAGLNDSRDVVQAQAQETQRLILAEIGQIESGAGQIAIDAGVSLVTGLRMAQAPALAAAHDLARGIHGNLAGIDAYPAGLSIGSSWIYGITQGIRMGTQAMLDQIAWIKRVTGGSLPTAGPLQHPETGGRSIAKAWIGGMVEELRGGLPLPGLNGNGASGGGFAGGAAPALAGGFSLPPIYISLDGRELSESNAHWGYFSQPGGPAPLPR
jgi:uncharacterized phage infection (PIP) family protein YhgE